MSKGLYLSLFAMTLPSVQADEFNAMFEVNATFTKADSYIDSLPPALVIGGSVTCMLVSLFLAFVGAKYEALSAFVSGSVISIAFGAILVTIVVPSISNEAAFYSLISCVLVGGLLGLCLMFILKLVFGVALSVICLSFLVQTGLIGLIGENWASYVVFAVIAIVVFLIGLKIHKFIQTLVCTSAAGCLFTIALSRLIDGDISILEVFSNPKDAGCNDQWRCWVSLASGFILFIVSTVYMYCQNYLREGKKKQKEKQKQKKVAPKRNHIITSFDTKGNIGRNKRAASAPQENLTAYV